MATTKPKPLTPAQREVLTNIEHLRRYMGRRGYQHYLAATPGGKVRDSTVDALFDRGLIRVNGEVGAEMTFALTDKGQEALHGAPEEDTPAEEARCARCGRPIEHDAYFGWVAVIVGDPDRPGGVR